jgi:hypothetical protein
VTAALGVGDEADEQHVAVDTVRRPIAKLVAPELERPPRAQLARRQADHVRTFAGPRDELKVVQPDLGERQLSQRHEPPTF